MIKTAEKYLNLITILIGLFLLLPSVVSLFGVKASAGECLDADITDVQGSEDLISYNAGVNISGVCIKSGNNMFDDKHSGLLTQNKTYEDGCYEVTGLNTAEIKVKRLKESRFCQGLSHIDIYTTVLATPTPTPSVTTSITPTVTPSDENNVNQDHKILICHVPPGNQENAHVIDVDKHAWENGHNPHNAHDMDFVVTGKDEKCPAGKTENPEPSVTPAQNNEQPTVTPQPTSVPGSVATQTPTNNENNNQTSNSNPGGRVLGGMLPETGDYENKLLFAGALLLTIGSRGYVTSTSKSKKKK